MPALESLQQKQRMRVKSWTGQTIHGIPSYKSMTQTIDLILLLNDEQTKKKLGLTAYSLLLRNECI